MKKIKNGFLSTFVIFILSISNSIAVDFGNALSLNGSSQYAVVDDSNGDYNITSTLTMEAWINPADTSGVSHIIGKWPPDGSGSNVRAYLLGINAGKVGVWLSNNGTAEQSFVSNTTISTNKWTHVALVFDSGEARIYINGVLDKTYSPLMAYATLYQGTDDFTIGATNISGGSASFFFNGQIDEARIWSSAKTQEEIKTNMLTTLNGDEINLEGYWNMDESSGTLVADISDNSNNGTLIGSPTFAVSDIQINPTVVSIPPAGLKSKGVAYSYVLSATNPLSIASFGDYINIDITSIYNADVILNTPTSSSADSQNDYLDGWGGNFFTQSYNSSVGADGLPDDGLFASNAYHRTIKLAYDNEDNGYNAIKLVSDDTISIEVLDNNYEYIHLFATAGSGNSDVKLKLYYDDNSTEETIVHEVPDWYFELLDENSSNYYVVNDLDRYYLDDFQNSDDPAIFGFRFDVDDSKTLTKFDVIADLDNGSTLAIFGLNISGSTLQGDISASGYDKFDWNITNGPDWLTLTNSTLSGTPNELGTQNVSLTVKSSYGTSTNYDFNLTVSGIQLDNNTIFENESIGTSIGELTGIGSLGEDIVSYSFCGGVDDNNFSINGTSLESNSIFDYETKSSYSICVQGVDDANNEYNKTISISVMNKNEAPVLEEILDVYLYTNNQSTTINLSITDIDTTVFNYSAVSSNSALVSDINFTDGNMTLAIVDNQFGLADINVTVNDGENNVSKVFKLRVLALEENSTIKDTGNVTVDENRTITVYLPAENITITAPTQADANGSISHNIDINGTIISSYSDINNSVVDITEYGVQTTYSDVNVSVEVNATIWGEASHTLSIDNKNTQAISKIKGAKTVINKDGNNQIQIETTLNSNGVDYTVLAKGNGQASHEVSFQNGQKSIATSTIVGAKTTINSDNSIETTVLSGFQEAMVVTNSNGTNIISMKDNSGNTLPTLDENSSFPVDTNLTIEEDSTGNLQIIVVSPIEQYLQF
jgi:hypothetical protein